PAGDCCYLNLLLSKNPYRVARSVTHSCIPSLLLLGRRELLKHLVQSLIDFVCVFLRFVAECVACTSQPEEFLRFSIANIHRQLSCWDLVDRGSCRTASPPPAPARTHGVKFRLGAG